jgi:hypothetical protein
VPRLSRAVAGVVAVLLALFLSGTASAAGGTTSPNAKPLPKGLFGNSDPTYDGVYRQSLALIALHTAGVKPGLRSIRWLRTQQCPDGGFMAYRPSTGTPCTKSKEDTNSTSLAMQALALVGDKAHSDPQRTAHAAQWLRKLQQPDGGFPYYPGNKSDSNSTGLVISGLAAINQRPGSSATGNTPVDFLRSQQVGCSAPPAQRGAFDYQAKGSPKPNDSATAQAVIGLLPQALPIRGAEPRNLVPTMSCPQSKPPTQQELYQSGAAYLAHAIKAGGGVLPSPAGGGPDYGTTANALLALAATGTGNHEIQDGLTYFNKHASSWVKGPGGTDQAGPLASLILLTYGTRGNARNLNGSNLIKRLRHTEVGGVSSTHVASPAQQNRLNVGLVAFAVVAGLLIVGLTVLERRRAATARTASSGT